jgi:hypothetical protein
MGLSRATPSGFSPSSLHDCREVVGYPMGSLLWWGRIGPEAV